MTAIIDRMPTIRPTYRCDSEFAEAFTEKMITPKFQFKQVLNIILNMTI